MTENRGQIVFRAFPASVLSFPGSVLCILSSVL